MSTPLLTPADVARIRARYPKSRWSGPRGRLLMGVLAVITLAWVIWAGSHRAATPVIGQVHSFRAESTHSVSVTIDVQRTDPTRTAVCTVTAVGLNGIPVGELDLQIPPAATKMTAASTTIRTTDKALSANVSNCRNA